MNTIKMQKSFKLIVVLAVALALVFTVIPLSPAEAKTVKKYTVTFDSNGGGPIYGSKTKISKTKIKSGYRAYPVGYAEKTGYELTGWFSKAKGGTNYSKGNKYIKGIKVKRNITFYAHWKLKKGYKRVTFNANGGQVIEKYMLYVGKKPKEAKFKVDASAKGIKKGKKLGTLPAVAKREGYTFLGWFTAKEGGTQLTNDVKLTSNKTYYAQWQQDEVESPVDPPAEGASQV